MRASGHKTNQSLNSSIGGDNQLDLESGDDLSVLILTEPEYVGAGNTLFKRRLAKLVTSKASSAAHAVVIAVRSARTPPQGTKCRNTELDRLWLLPGNIQSCLLILINEPWLTERSLGINHTSGISLRSMATSTLAVVGPIWHLF